MFHTSSLVFANNAFPLFSSLIRRTDNSTLVLDPILFYMKVRRGECCLVLHCAFRMRVVLLLSLFPSSELQFELSNVLILCIVLCVVI